MDGRKRKDKRPLGALLKKIKKYRRIEDFFFKLEDLPKFGKEYWYFHLVNPKKRQQLLITIGRSEVDFKVRGAKIKTNKENQSKIKCAAVAWLYDGNKELLIDGPVNLEICDSELIMSNRTTTIRIGLKHLEIKKGGKIVCKVEIKDPRRSRSRELVDYFIDGFGGGMGNFFHVFTGKMNGKDFSGSAYLQKIVCSLPIVPWHWIRIAFEDGSIFDLFNVNIAGRPIFSRLNFYYAKDDKNYVINNVNVRTYLNYDKWVAIKKGHVFLDASAYSVQPFVIETIGKFHYDEYMVEAKDLEVNLGKGRKVTIEDLGRGQGTTENAYGFTL